MLRKGNREYIPGFQEDIHPGVWNRHLMFWAPQKLTMAWLALCGYAFAWILYALPVKLLVPLAIVWMVGQGIMIYLTKLDPQWDDVGIASFKTRRYKSRYEAG